MTEICPLTTTFLSSGFCLVKSQVIYEPLIKATLQVLYRLYLIIQQ
jgi:hypothetical protein